MVDDQSKTTGGAQPVLYRWNDGDESQLGFECPGCGMHHAVRVRSDGGPRPSWEWNGSMSAPTFSPSILVRWEQRGEQRVCHSFVRDGRIEFCGDCTHDLAGKTAPLPAVESDGG